MLASAGDLIGFCGGGGTPLLMANEIEWFNPQSEYRPTEYVLGWLLFWFDEQKRLTVAKQFQTRRGALVFDVTDLVIDALILPWAFVCAKEKISEQEFRQQILQTFTRIRH